MMTVTNNNRLIYNPTKRNLKLREKIENEMLVNRSLSQEAAYNYITSLKKVPQNSVGTKLSIIGIVVLFVICFGRFIM